jgi:RNA polymerase sigma factor (sigma-70 family)
MSRMGHPQPTPPAASEADEVQQPLTRSVIDTLVANHREFLSFLERRVGDRALAEDILQEAFVRGIDRIATLRDGESVVAWFYRSLRNAATDAFRRKGAEGRALDRAARELADSAEPGPELKDAVCRCVARLADTLKPEYAVALRRIEVDGLSVKDFAQQRRGACVQGTRGAAQAGRRRVRELRGARLPGVPLQRAVRAVERTAHLIPFGHPGPLGRPSVRSQCRGRTAHGAFDTDSLRPRAGSVIRWHLRTARDGG